MPIRAVISDFGGAFLITPGFITDVVGLLFLLPPTRALIRRWIVRGAGRRFAIFVTDPRGRRTDPRARGDWDVEGTAWETHDPPRHLDR